MLIRIFEKTRTMAEVTGDTYTTAEFLDNVSTLSVQSVITVNTPSDITFVDGDVTVAADTVTKTAHGLPTGLKLQLTTSGTLPAGLATSTDYFIIDVDADTYAFASSLANAIAGTKVDITAAAGGGTHTVDITALTGATISYQRTNIRNAAGDGPSTLAADWSDIDAATAITATVTNWYAKVGPEASWFRVKSTLTAGSMTITNYEVARGEDSK